MSGFGNFQTLGIASRRAGESLQAPAILLTKATAGLL
jgi:hypothetical protein